MKKSEEKQLLELLDNPSVIELLKMFNEKRQERGSFKDNVDAVKKHIAELMFGYNEDGEYYVKWQQHDCNGEYSKRNSELIYAESPEEAWMEAWRQGEHANDYLISINGVRGTEFHFAKDSPHRGQI